MPAMVTLQRRLDHGSDSDREQRFFSRTLQHLTTISGRHVEMKDWMVTSYKVEFGHKIGSGGLYGVLNLLWSAQWSDHADDSGEVFVGTWNGTQVAMKVLKKGGIAASSDVHYAF